MQRHAAQSAKQTILPPSEAEPSIDEELHAWKRDRRKHQTIPWQQLSLMAGLCFGIGSLVLPAWVNGAVQWPLYALTAMSFYVWLRKRKAAGK